jgi:hypothetical protein
LRIFVLAKSNATSLRHQLAQNAEHRSILVSRKSQPLFSW